MFKQLFKDPLAMAQVGVMLALLATYIITYGRFS